jgi:hypothetical protein
VTFVDTAVTIQRDDGISCMQVFSLGEATVSAVVRDAQGSPVTTYALPVDLRLCDPPLLPGAPPRCPAVHARLVGDVQAMPVAGVVTFNNFSVTNVSSGVGYVLQLYTPLLLVAYSLPFRACDAGVPQEDEALAMAAQAIGLDLSTMSEEDAERCRSVLQMMSF